MTDPWIEGTAFNDGWALIEPTRMGYADFSSITHIFFTHEHPDHFSPPNLKNIPQAIRNGITILYQHTKDKKVVRYCEKLGFRKCIELPPEWVELAPGFKVLNVPHTDGDSWMCVKAGSRTILNINDCVLEDDGQVMKVRSRIGSDSIDVLFTQFSYANWAGNREDRTTRRRFAEKKLNEMNRQTSIFQPTFTIPFASFVWFCHEENFYMNDEVNRIDAVHSHIIEHSGSTPVVLFPGEQWEVGEGHDSAASVQKWLDSVERNVKSERTIRPSYVDETELIRSGDAFIGTLKKNNTRWMNLFLKPSNVFIEDHHMAYELSLKGFRKTGMEQENCDISLSSDSMNYCFKFLWGGATTRVNGRFQVPGGGRFYNWKMYFQTSELNNHGDRFGLGFILQSLYRNLRRKIYS